MRADEGGDDTHDDGTRVDVREQRNLSWGYTVVAVGSEVWIVLAKLFER